MSAVIVLHAGRDIAPVICAHGTVQPISWQEWPVLVWARVDLDVGRVAANDDDLAWVRQVLRDLRQRGGSDG